MKIAYFDCFAGAGGDMIVASMIDAGLDQKALVASLKGLHLEFEIRISHEMRCGIKGTRFEPVAAHQHHHRHLPDIIKIIESAAISQSARQNAINIFRRLGEAEARIHNIDISEVHFHEVGAIDSIVDIVAACLGFEMLGIEKVFCSVLTVGSGTVKTEHGLLPVPAPATAELIKGIPITPGPEAGEMLTPTAAAILTTFAQSIGPMPAMTIEQTGYGAGTRNCAGLPNVLRMVIGTAQAQADTESDVVCLLETNCDDITGELAGYILEQAMHKGALDAFSTAIGMKQGRPAVMLSILCTPADSDKFERLIFEQGISLGIRRQMISRSKLPRSVETITTEYGPIRVKISRLCGKVVHFKPEFADCVAAAERFKVPVKTVIEAVARSRKNE